MDDSFENNPLLKLRYKAEKKLKTGQNKQAIYLFSLIINNPDSSQLPDEILSGCYNNRGIALRNSGDPLKALNDFEQAIKLNPKNYFYPYV